MNLADLNHLKNLSWYTTVPLLVCAWLLHDFSASSVTAISFFQLLETVLLYFGKVIGGLIILYIVWLYASIYIDLTGFPITLLLATFLLTLSAVGLGIHFFESEEIDLPINVVWFLSFASIAFNLYQLNHNITEDLEKRA